MFKRWAHPHVCGEHKLYLTDEGFEEGSSPRMRGTPKTIQGMATDTGLIPTYAGNTMSIKRQD